MLDNGRKTIGIFVFEAIDYFQKTLCKGIEKRCQELGYNVVVFSSFGDFSRNVSFSHGEEIISEVPDYSSLAGAIIALDTMDIPSIKSGFLEHLKNECPGPVVSIRERNDFGYNIVVDDNKLMDSMLRHLIEFHGYKDICFVTGYKESVDAQKRLQNYLDVMEEYHLPVDESMYLYGDFWRWNGKKYCDQLIDQRGKMPEAIACANDYMAIAVCHELQKRGIAVPEQIAVCGCDGIWETRVSAPPLSTSVIDFENMGRIAVDIVDGKITEKTIIFEATCVFRDSCGCVKDNRWEELYGRKEFYDMYEQDRLHNMWAAFSSTQLESVDSLEQLGAYVRDNLYILENCESYQICLQDKVLDSKGGIEYGEPIGDYMNLTINVNPKYETQPSGIRFERKELLPKEILSKDPMIVYVVPFHFKEKNFGYSVAQMVKNNGGGYAQNYQEWTVNLENSLQDLFNRTKMNEMINRLSDLSIHDSMTGIYNRYGFDQEGRALFEREHQDLKYIFFLAIDLDGLKKINDQWGHAEGDRAILAIARALKCANNCNAIMARMGGDEFNVIGVCDDKQVVKTFVAKFKEEMKVEDARRKYHVHASVGEYIIESNRMESWDECLRRCDNEMYSHKKNRR